MGKIRKQSPGRVRDAIIHFLDDLSTDASVGEIQAAVNEVLGEVPPSSIRSYLRLKPHLFVRTARGRYQLSKYLPGFETPFPLERPQTKNSPAVFRYGRAILVHADCFRWLEDQPDNSIHAIVTDPPYGLVEYSEKEQKKLKTGKGGVWRIPPSFDGHQRSPLPRFTILSPGDLQNMRHFFLDFGKHLVRVLVPGAHVFLASNPLVFSIVATALADAGLETRGSVTRLTMTMRGGDRPKNAHKEFHDVSVMPRSMLNRGCWFASPSRVGFRTI